MSDEPVALLVLLAVLGIAGAAALSAGEVAVNRVSRAAVTELVAERHPAAPRVRALVEHPVRVTAAASFVRLLLEMTATVCIVLAVAAGSWEWWVVLLVSVALCGLVAFVFVRVSPRSLGRRHPVRTLTLLSRPLTLATAVAGRVGRAASTPGGSAEEDEEELRDMVQRVSESEAIEDEEREMFRSVLELGDTLTREVMVPRTDMVTTSADTPLRKALALLLRSGFSRVPVVGESVDDLLRELQAGASHLALVVDEYGGIAGLVTIEDALEEIVGELTDEHDPSAPVVEQVADGLYRVPARFGRDELGELFGIEVDDEDVDTAGGLLAKALGKVPLPGSEGEIHGLHLVADRAEGRRRRLATVLVDLVEPHPPAQDDPARATNENHGAAR